MSRPRTVAVLCGGVGGSRFLRGLAKVFDNDKITAIVNTGDDIVLHGLYISPDVDTVLYALAGMVDDSKGWGIKGDSFRCLRAMRKLGVKTWFSLGDQDIATHILRTRLIGKGQKPSQVTRLLAERLGVKVRVIPMTDDRLETRIKTKNGWLHFQEYLVKRRMQDRITGIAFVGIEDARPAPGVIEAVTRSDLLVIPPSNPVVSVGTILSLRGVRTAVRRRRCSTIGVSPVIGGKVVRGPLAKMMRYMGLEVSSLSVARMYRDIIDGFVLDNRDAKYDSELRRMGIAPHFTDILMSDIRASARLANETVEFSRTLAQTSVLCKQRYIPAKSGRTACEQGPLPS